MSLRTRKGASSADLGVLALRKLPVLPLQLFCDLVSHLLASIFDHSLDDAAGVVLENNVLDLAADNTHEGCDMFLTLGSGNVLLAGKGPEALCFGDERCIRFGRSPLFKESSLSFVRFPSS